ncbi:hypothetical protein ASPZODRAFT_546868 [Penicilliopsis zonata CBS 506.65]|uniref:Uncharacterized protein n=1 Tax=Penicilliopsis zonata CBS 506.65 TaxID=1073090 RepID=A0A1L9SFH3_9EURO|nr:hypothetical protein ASPZODRAFT_546868 [Penicilliopsis zonata CBS 506.65]OJJ45929.1 hypothetical protein ASPZODRAFT_546868 [Penicilliopsis zonata CBS 506.65]
MESFYPLKSLYESYCHRQNACAVHLEKFFHKTLDIPNVGAEDLLAELEMLRSSECRNLDRIRAVYECLNGMIKKLSPISADLIRKRFSDSPLVYVDTRWYTISQCLWSTRISILGKAVLEESLYSLKSFFVDFLHVESLTLQMLVDRLRDCRVFPVRYPDGQVRLETMNTPFVIADRKRLFTLFSPVARILDFNVDEVVQLSYFLYRVGLSKEYMSQQVEEITALKKGDAGRPLSDLTLDIRSKAHGLLRLAVHFQSPRALHDKEALYRTLRTIEIRETDKISSKITLYQIGNEATVEVVPGELHLDNNDGRLTVYVTKDQPSRDICFLDRVPQVLMEWIMVEPLNVQHDGLEI